MKGINVLIATKSPFDPAARDAAVAILTEREFSVRVLEKYKDVGELHAAVKDAHALIVRSDEVNRAVLDAAPELKLVIRGGAGYNNIDVEACTERGIIVMNTPGQNSNAVAELALAFMLASVRFIVKADVSTKAGEFLKAGLTGRELMGKKLGIHGFGYIGQHLAQKARGCGMEVFAYDPWVNPEIAEDFGTVLVKTPEELYRDADFISLHIPKTKNTVNSINYDLISLMKPDGVLVNTARAEIVQYDDLERLLTERPEFVYAADVQPEGDVPGEKRLAKFGSQVILTPHEGASTKEANFNTIRAAAIQTVEFFEEGKMTAAVNKEVVPYWMQEYAELARMLGHLCASMIDGQPREVQVICYGELEQYRHSLAENVLKGIYAGYDRGLTPHAAVELAAQTGVTLRTDIKPDNLRGHGNSITVDYMVRHDHSLTQVGARGTMSDKMLKISRIKEFLNVDFRPEGLVTVFEYAEKEGMVDVIGEYFTKAGYNKKQGRFTQSPDGTKAISVFQIEKKSGRAVPPEYPNEDAEVKAIVETIRSSVPEILNGYSLRF